MNTSRKPKKLKTMNIPPSVSNIEQPPAPSNISEDLRDETTSINSIYDDNTLILLPPPCHHPGTLAILTLPHSASLSLRLHFPPDYPTSPPAILGTQTTGTHRDAAALVAHARRLLAALHVPHAPSIYTLIEELTAADALPGPPPPPDAADAHAPPSPQHTTPMPRWSTSSKLTLHKSVFVGRATRATSAAHARQLVQQLVATDKRAARATHNIAAWRTGGGGGGKEVVMEEGAADDGESGAGARMLTVLRQMGACDVVVVVSRAFGGVKLGPDRFRMIGMAAKEAVVDAGFQGGKEAGV